MSGMTGRYTRVCTLRPSTRCLMTAVLLPTALALGCGEIPRALAEIESLQDRTRALLEQRVEEAAADAAAAETALAEAQTAHQSAPGRDYVYGGEPTPEDLEKQRLRDVLQEARTTRNDAVNFSNRVKRYLDDARTRHSNRLRRLRNAYEDDTWELIRTDVSPRSIVLNARQQAERELSRLEAGCTSPVVLRRNFGTGAEVEPGCEDGGGQ